MIHLFLIPGRIEKEYSPVLDALKDIVTGYIAGIMAGYKFSRINQIGRLNGSLAKAQMGNGKSARLFGIIFKIALSVHVCMVADNFNGILIRAYSAVRAQTVEFAAHNALGSRIYKNIYVQRIAGNVVVNAHCEMILGLGNRSVVIYSLDHAGRELFGAQAVTSAQNGYIIPAGVLKRGAYVGIKRLAHRAGLLGAVHGYDGLAACRNGGNEMFKREGAIKTNLNQAQLLAVFIKVIDSFFNGVAA